MRYKVIIISFLLSVLLQWMPKDGLYAQKGRINSSFVLQGVSNYDTVRVYVGEKLLLDTVLTPTEDFHSVSEAFSTIPKNEYITVIVNGLYAKYPLLGLKADHFVLILLRRHTLEVTRRPITGFEFDFVANVKPIK